MRLSIIIVSYNTKQLLKNCLNSIFAHKPSAISHMLEVIVVDNASTDGSSAMINTDFPQVKLIQNRDNVGFGLANNQAAKFASGDYLLFLNSDTEVTGANLKNFLEFAIYNQSSIASCRLINRNHSLQPQGGALPHLINLSAWMLFVDDLPLIKRVYPAYQRRDPHYFNRNQHPGWVAGTALLVKSDDFKSLGGFNPEIFMYGEDVDFCFRAKSQGLRVDYFCKPQITHLGQGSGTSESAILGELKFLRYFYAKYKPHYQSILLHLILKTGCLLRIVTFGMIGRYESKISYQKAWGLV